jgi:hypothetical protein
MALEATAQHQHQRQRKHQDGSDAHSSRDRGTDPPAVKANVPTEIQTPTGNRDCDDDKKYKK